MPIFLVIKQWFGFMVVEVENKKYVGKITIKTQG